MSRPRSTVRTLSIVLVTAAVAAAATACRSAPTVPPPSTAAAVAAPTTPEHPRALAAAPSSPMAAPASASAEPSRGAPPLLVTVTALAAMLRSTPAPPIPHTGGGGPAYSGGGGGGLANPYTLVAGRSPARYSNGGAPASRMGALPLGMPASGRASQAEGTEGESYAPIDDNPFLAADDAPLSTFALDVDSASYANVRRYLTAGDQPPPDAVRIEELLNAFRFDDPPPVDDRPFAIHVESADAPWAPAHRLVRIGLKGRPIADDARPAANLVFLIDVSGSMQEENKLPLVKLALRLLVDQLHENDRVSIVVYAGNSGLVLPPTAGADRAAIGAAVEGLEAGGSTAGGEGIALAYDVAASAYIDGGVNRIILATDGDFNVGLSDPAQLERLVETRAKEGGTAKPVFLTVLGFGTGNVRDDMLETLADRGNGQHGYIDSAAEARKVFVEELGGTLVTIAKDVKLQVEFNPAQVAGYRLLGYENRLLAAEAFNDDAQDGGEMGAGHSMTALYEVVPAGGVVPATTPSATPEPSATWDPQLAALMPPTATADPAVTPTPTPEVDALRYQGAAADPDAGRELLVVKMRYKEPDGASSTRMTVPVVDAGAVMAAASPDLHFAAAVAAFGLLLRNSPYKGGADLAMVADLAAVGKGADGAGYRQGFIELVKGAMERGVLK
ncbi:MAG: von Willebrand factor type A domain-containing protein [Ardenticatenales bacterium]